MSVASSAFFESGWAATVLFISLLVAVAALEAVREYIHPPATRVGLFSFHAPWGPPVRTISRRVLIISAVVLLALAMFELGIHFKDVSSGVNLDVATPLHLPPSGLPARLSLSSQAPLRKEQSTIIVAAITTQRCAWKPIFYDVTLATQALETTPFFLLTSRGCQARWSAVATPKLSGVQLASAVVRYHDGTSRTVAATMPLGRIAAAPYSIDTWLSVAGIVISNAVTICVAVFLPSSTVRP